MKKKSPFHSKPITRGTYGELSKVKEELEEALDAAERGIDLLVLIELADIIGAVAGVAEEQYGYTLEGLMSFSELVRSVKSKEAIDFDLPDSLSLDSLKKLEEAAQKTYQEDPENGKRIAEAAHLKYGVVFDLDPDSEDEESDQVDVENSNDVRNFSKELITEEEETVEEHVE